MGRARNLGVIGVVLAACFFWSAAVLADDINFPSYAGSANSAAVFWDMDPNAAGGLAFGGFDFNVADFPLTDHDGGGGAGQPSFSVQSDGFDFFMPNYVDPLPLKKMRIQLTFFADVGVNGPSIAGIDGHDPTGPVFAHFVTHVVDTAETLGAGYFYEDWELGPNPDWEIVHVVVPNGSQLAQVVIDSYSTVPEPASLVLLGLALGGLAVLRRRPA